MDVLKLREIKSSFRRAMNADLSNSMRAHGVLYKINFGVPAPRMKLIASSFEPNVDDATYLWNEDVRESKILATYLYPKESMTLAIALEWVDSIRYVELADQLAMNLLAHLPFASELIDSLLQQPSPMAHYTAYRLQMRLFIHTTVLADSSLVHIKQDLLSPITYLAQAAIQLLERLTDLDASKQPIVSSLLQDWRNDTTQGKSYLYETICYWDFDK